MCVCEEMNAIQKIEVVQAIVAILVPNYGTFLFYIWFDIHSQDIYDGLIVPSWTPRFLIFKLIWTFFYCIIGFASFLLLKQISPTGDQVISKIAKVVLILLYTSHIPACWAWLPFLGGLKSIGWAAVAMIIASSSAIVVTPLMWIANKTAAVLFIPHIGWIIFLTTWTLSVT